MHRATPPQRSFIPLKCGRAGSQSLATPTRGKLGWPRTRLASWGSPGVTNLGARRRREVGDEPLGTASAADPRATDRGGLKNQNGNGRVLIRKLHVVCNV